MSATAARPTAPSRPLRARGARPGRRSRRRLVGTVLTAPVLAGVLVDAGGGWAPGEAPLWTVLVVITAVVGAAVLASYLPLRGEGLRAGLGCSPCAVASGASVLGAAVLVASAPHQASMAVVACGLVGFGLFQRRRGSSGSCPA